MNNQIIDGKRKVISIIECSNKVEPGVFFGGDHENNLAHAVVRKFKSMNEHKNWFV